MGYGMAKNLLEQHEVYIIAHKNRDPIDRLLKEGAIEVYSYNDLEAGQTDVDMNYFSLEEDKKYVIPVMKEILQIVPNMKILASPWSPPTWMKTNKSSIGGSLKPEFYEAYSKYLVKYIEHMALEGIIIDAITVQNEPLHPHNNPSMLMLADEQANFIKYYLGPIFETKSIKTKIRTANTIHFSASLAA